MNNTKFRILVLNGPNLNLLGTREPKVYGNDSLSKVVDHLFDFGSNLGVCIDHFQSNAEHKLIHRVHRAYNNTHFIVVNPAGLSHTSVVLRDAFLAVNIPCIEVHLSNIYMRESFRHYSYFSDIAIGVICGFGVDGYCYAIDMAVKYLSKSYLK